MRKDDKDDPPSFFKMAWMVLVPSSTPDYTENVRITRGISWVFFIDVIR